MSSLLSAAFFVGLSFFATSKASASDQRPYPGHQCMGECTPSQLKIWNGFESGINLTPKISGQVFSGDCHMKGVNYDGETTHHGVVFFSPAGGEIHMEGRFSFFSNGNIYANWTPADAIRELQPTNDPLSLITFDESFAWVDFHPNQIPMQQYYFRQNTSVGKVYLVGIWGEKHTLFCEMTPNQI